MSRINRRRFAFRSAGALGLALGAGQLRWARGQAVAAPAAMAEKAAAFLKSRQDEKGLWSADRKEPGITALVVAGLLKSGRVTAHEPVVTKALDYLAGILPQGTGDTQVSHAIYATSVAMTAFQAAKELGNDKYDKLVAGAVEFLKARQWDEAEGKTPSDVFYGGAGYGGKSNRPDLSNTAFMVEALHETGLKADDPAFQKALRFVSRCQNLDSEFNDQPWAKLVNDGGFIYTPADGGTSVAGKNDDGGLRSYSSMTYAGLKSMIYAGLTASDPRVKAALEFIKKHYSLEENYGLGQGGLYYYYVTFARAMAAMGEDTFVDAEGRSHDWRAELVAALASRQKPDGSWLNSADRFMEGDPNLVTAYGLLALGSAQKKS